MLKFILTFLDLGLRFDFTFFSFLSNGTSIVGNGKQCVHFMVVELGSPRCLPRALYEWDVWNTMFEAR